MELVIDRSGDLAPAPGLLADADALIGFCSPPVMEGAGERFLWLHNYFVGMDRCATVPQEQLGGRVFTNGKRLSGPTIAEHAIAMMLSLARGLPAYQRAQLNGEWDRSLSGMDSLRRGAAIAVENLRRYVEGEALLNRVDTAAVY